MSVEATGWAFRQRVPPKPKMVLMALADQTDEKTGRVCYGKTDLSHLAEKACVPVRTLHRYINAFVRNGYMLSESGKGKGKPNSYWLCLDRPMAESLEEWKWWTDPSDEHDEPQDVVEGSATVADPNSGENSDEGLPPNGRGGMPYVADQESLDKPKNIEAAGQRNQTRSFSREAQDAERDNHTVCQAAERAGAQVFVIEGTRAWNAWCDQRKSFGKIGSLPTCNGIGEHAGKRGWYMPSLFPPSTQTSKATGPPQHNLSEQDMQDFK